MRSWGRCRRSGAGSCGWCSRAARPAARRRRPGRRPPCPRRPAPRRSRPPQDPVAALGGAVPAGHPEGGREPGPTGATARSSQPRCRGGAAAAGPRRVAVADGQELGGQLQHGPVEGVEGGQDRALGLLRPPGQPWPRRCRGRRTSGGPRRWGPWRTRRGRSRRSRRPRRPRRGGPRPAAARRGRWPGGGAGSGPAARGQLQDQLDVLVQGPGPGWPSGPVPGGGVGELLALVGGRGSRRCRRPRRCRGCRRPRRRRPGRGRPPGGRAGRRRPRPGTRRTPRRRPGCRCGPRCGPAGRRGPARRSARPRCGSASARWRHALQPALVQPPVLEPVGPVGRAQPGPRSVGSRRPWPARPAAAPARCRPAGTGPGPPPGPEAPWQRPPDHGAGAGLEEVATIEPTGTHGRR